MSVHIKSFEGLELLRQLAHIRGGLPEKPCLHDDEEEFFLGIGDASTDDFFTRADFDAAISTPKFSDSLYRLQPILEELLMSALLERSDELTMKDRSKLLAVAGEIIELLFGASLRAQALARQAQDKHE
ncbi:TPA: hypothetical protein QHO67_002374 [Escherichia coli]|nr:hypothetical protein [Escherichia coli]